MTTARHPDLFDSDEAAAYMGVSRLDKLPEEFRPRPIAYKATLYHRDALDDAIARAAAQSTGKASLRRVG